MSSVHLEMASSTRLVQTPGHYVGAEAVEEDDQLIDDKMKRLVGELKGHFAKSMKLESAIRFNLEGLGYGG